MAAGALMLGATMGSSALANDASPSRIPSPTSGPAFLDVVSDDGRLTLEVPVAAIPAGVTLTATAVHSSVPSVAAYVLRPTDISLPAPIRVTWQLDPAGAPPATDGDLVWLGLAWSGDPGAGPWEWLGDPHVDVVGGAYAVTGRLARFGAVIVTLQDARIHGPAAIWGRGYELANGLPVDLDLSLVTQSGGPAAAAFSGDWRFSGGYPERIDVVQTTANADALAATWQCRRTGETSLVSTFGVREAPPTASGPSVPPHTASGPSTPLGVVPGLPPAAAVVSVSFPVTCGVQHPGTNG